MRGRTSRPAEEANVDLTPMLDVVFILLIFFIVTSTFIQEKAIGAEPPPPSGGDSSKTSPAILVFVTDSNQITVNRKPTDFASLRPSMERLRAENPESALIIQAHPAASTGLVVRIRDEAYKAEMERVNIVRSEG